MTQQMGVAELKRRFSEVLNRVELRGDRIVVRRRGRAVAMLGPATTNNDLEVSSTKPRRGLAAAAGAWEEHPDVDGFLVEIRAARDASTDRSVEILE